jgi:hypothetical protein
MDMRNHRKTLVWENKTNYFFREQTLSVYCSFWATIFLFYYTCQSMHVRRIVASVKNVVELTMARNG